MTPRAAREGLRPQRARVYTVPDDVLKKHLPRDRVARERENYRERPDPSFVTYGPKTRREFLTLQGVERGLTRAWPGPCRRRAA